MTEYFNNNEYIPEADYEDDIDFENIDSNILFEGNVIKGNNKGYEVENNKLIIKSQGSYYLSGSFKGHIEIDCDDEVYLIFGNLEINSENNPAINVINAKKVIINLEENTINTLNDNNQNIETNATIYSKDDLVIKGTGTLNINGNNHGISCNDTLQIIDGTYNITTNNDAIRGKDYLVIKKGIFNIMTNSDGIKSTNEEDENLGYIIIENGTFNINTTNDGISAITNLTINNGIFNIKTTSTDSSKGIKSDDKITINNGVFNLDTSDDSIHGNNVYINGGNFEIKTQDDAIHGDSNLKIEAGNINITSSYEGLEATEITINGGNIHLIATDDGINCAGGKDSSGMQVFYNRPFDMFASSNGKLYINDGYIYIDSKGDGIDINGSGIINGGSVIVSGPIDNGNGALDYDSTFDINGGLFIATGSSGMLQTPSSSSLQHVISATFNSTTNAICIDNLIAIKPNKTYQSLIISSPILKKGETYDIYLNCEIANEIQDGIYEDYTLGELYSEVTINNIITNVGNKGYDNMSPGSMFPGGFRPERR